jgi:hypothetical protein
MVPYLLIGLGIVVVAILAMLKFLRNVQPDDGEVEEDLKELKKMCAQYKGGLEQFSEEISSSDLDQVLQTGRSRTGSGVFLSTLGQPIMAFAYRKYIGPGMNATLYVLTSDHEFVYRYTTKGAEITIDGQKQGIMRANGKLYDIRNDEIAAVQRNGATAQNKMFIGNREIGRVALPDATAGLSAIKLDAQLQPKDAQIMQTLAVHELVSNISNLNG